MCVVLGHGQRLPVSIECVSPLLEPSEIAVRQPSIEPLGLSPILYAGTSPNSTAQQCGEIGLTPMAYATSSLPL